MAIKDAIEYLKQNSGKFPLDQLLTQLRNAGYPETELQEAVSILHGGNTPAKPVSTSGKIVRFIFGFIVGIIIMILLQIGVFVGIFVIGRYALMLYYIVIAVILSLEYYFGLSPRRKYGTIGLMSSIIMSMVIPLFRYSLFNLFINQF